MEPQNEVDKYAVAVVDNENNVIRPLPRGKSWKDASTLFYFLKTDPFNICHVQIIGKGQYRDENRLSTTIHWEL